MIYTVYHSYNSVHSSTNVCIISVNIVIIRKFLMAFSPKVCTYWTLSYELVFMHDMWTYIKLLKSLLQCITF